MNFSDDRQIVSAGKTRSINNCRDSLSIPTDLIIEIFSRLPAKSVARYRFLSKFWFNQFCSQHFIDLFAAKSAARPQFLFLNRNESCFSFFTAHQLSENSCDNIEITHLTDYPLSHEYYKICRPINGLVCLNEYVDGMEIPIIYNPSTAESLSLPKMKTMWTHIHNSNLFGYDPTKKQFKVLTLYYDNMQWLEEGANNNDVVKSEVITLETKEMSWRMIECCKPHIIPSGSEICINGVLYYRALGVLNVQLIVCFDVRSETFKFVENIETLNQEFLKESGLINYNDKLGLLIPCVFNNFITGESISFELWVLKDTEKHEWSKLVYVLPPLSENIVGDTPLHFVKMIGTNEIVFSPWDIFGNRYLVYYNIEQKTFRKLNIQGMEGSTTSRELYMYVNHVEDVSLFKLLKKL